MPQIIGSRAILRTHCPTSADAIEVHLDPNRSVSHRPDRVVMSVVAPGKQVLRDDLRGAFCQHVLLFRDEPAFHDWAMDRKDVAVVTLDEAHTLGAQRNTSRYPDIVF